MTTYFFTAHVSQVCVEAFSCRAHIEEYDEPSIFSPTQATLRKLREMKRTHSQHDVDVERQRLYREDMLESYRANDRWSMFTGQTVLVTDACSDDLAAFRLPLATILKRIGWVYGGDLGDVYDRKAGTHLWVDTETGGFSPSDHALLEVGALMTRGVDGPVVDALHATLRTPGAINDQAAQINGYRGADWDRSMRQRPEDYVRDFVQRYDLTHLVGWNAPFDAGFLSKVADVSKLTLLDLRKGQKGGLQKNLERYGLDAGMAHTAEGDIVATRVLHRHLVQGRQSAKSL